MMSRAAEAKTTAGWGYLPQLDGLRALSVLMVMLAHFMPEGYWTHKVPFAGFGVRCFFVLSGYLITSILLHARHAVEVGGVSRGIAVRNFYLRRCLRIFPVYYLTVFVIYALNVQHARESFPWLMTYTANILFAIRGYLYWSVGHFWSLSVEEQFYLVWPLLILFAPRRWLPWGIAAVVALSPLFQLCCRLAGPHWYTGMITLPLASTDSLGLGAALALLEHSLPHADAIRRRLERAGWWIGLPLFVVFSLLRAIHWHPLGPQVLSTLAQSLFLVGVVSQVARGFPGLLGRLLGSRPMRYLGKISYGMYVYHVFMLLLVPWLLRPLGLALPEQPVLRFLLLSAATLAVSTVSWFLLESRLNRLKRHFPC
jgi:peptidoglycan/LPS O-acetylase OafA/YrhL